VNLEAQISKRLWSEIQSNYESRDYSGAILDSVYFLSELIRQRTGLEADGVSLVGQAFGGKNPKLKVNKFQTESELNVQQGIEQLLRGIYQAIRNPRSHEKHNDTQPDADSINYVAGERYAALLIEEIPVRQRRELFVDVFAARQTGDCEKLKDFLRALFNAVTPDEQAELRELISEELKTASADAQIRTAICVVEPAVWPHLSEVARLRIENRMLDSISEGKYDVRERKCVNGAGALGTWCRELLPHFTLKEQISNALIRKLAGKDRWSQDYVFKFFFESFDTFVPSPSKPFLYVVSQGLKRGDKRFLDAAHSYFDGPYHDGLAKAVAEFVEQPEVETPFPEDDVPF